MMDRNLLEILACPETLQPLRPAADALVAKLNARIAEGSLHDRLRRPVLGPVDALLVREDERYAYPVRDRIPALGRDEAIPLLPETEQ